MLMPEIHAQVYLFSFSTFLPFEHSTEFLKFLETRVRFVINYGIALIQWAF